MKKWIKDLDCNEVINVTSEKGAIKLCNKFHELGLTWCDNESYLQNTYYSSYKKETCYKPKKGIFLNIESSKERNYSIYTLSDLLDFENELPKKWFIKGGEELVNYLKTIDTNVIGSNEIAVYTVVNNNWKIYLPIEIEGQGFEELSVQQYLTILKNIEKRKKYIRISPFYLEEIMKISLPKRKEELVFMFDYYITKNIYYTTFKKNLDILINYIIPEKRDILKKMFPEHFYKHIEKDTVVYVKNSYNEWIIRYFSHFNYGTMYCFKNQKSSKQTNDIEKWDTYTFTFPLKLYKY